MRSFQANFERMDIEVTPDGWLCWPGHRVRCALGKGGVKTGKREGDGATPAGTWPVRRVLYRPDRLDAPQTGLPVAALSPTDSWCDDIAHPAYNTQVRLPFAASHEELWRTDEVYDVIVVLGHNDSPPVPGIGSAIFMHVARPGYTPTAGCVALALPDLLELLKACGEEARLEVKLS